MNKILTTTILALLTLTAAAQYHADGNDLQQYPLIVVSESYISSIGYKIFIDYGQPKKALARQTVITDTTGTRLKYKSGLALVQSLLAQGWEIHTITETAPQGAYNTKYFLRRKGKGVLSGM